MAVVTTKSSAISARDSGSATDALVAGSFLREAVGTVEIANGDSVGSKYPLMSVPSNARVSQLLVSCDDVGTTTIADFGVYKSTADGGTVVDADFFGSAVSLKDGALNESAVHNESGANDIANIEKPLWQALGLTADPGIMYDIVATLTGAADAAGTLSAKCRFVI